MPLNLVTDAWIPVRTSDGGQWIIRPDQISEAGVVRPDWPRADFNLACYELLIGLVYLCDPPKHARQWRSGLTPNPEQLREKMAPLAPAFNLDGDGPRFLQDIEPLDGEAQGVDMLFIDSSGGNTAKNNADLMVKRGRYSGLPLPLAAMALFTLQSQAPSGGAGNRTSMRGGGPLITLVDPGNDSATPLWGMVWTNVPDGQALDPSDLAAALPWMRKTRTSESGKVPTEQHEDSTLALTEMFFGMPRRLRFSFSTDTPPLVTGVQQRPYGTNYGLWKHPLSPYYQQKIGSEMLPMHPRPGLESFRNWAGIVFQKSDGLRHVADTLVTWQKRNPSSDKASLHIGGWAMDNMKPRDFLWSRQPLFPLAETAVQDAVALVEAANAFSMALAGALQTVVGASSMDATSVEPVREAFYIETQASFEALLSRLVAGEELSGDGGKTGLARDWVVALRKVALRLFEDRAMPGLANRSIEDVEAIVAAQRKLQFAFYGYGPKTGQAAFNCLGLSLPKKKVKKDDIASKENRHE